MVKEGIAPAAISAFETAFTSLAVGETGIIHESTISPVPVLLSSSRCNAKPGSTSLLKETVVLKLNGGLGSTMGLDKAKSFLKVKDDNNFLDLTAKQIMKMRETYGFKVKFMLMNSFSTSADTMAFFKKNYPALAAEEGLEMLQNKVPKIDIQTLTPAVCGSYPQHEWYPPGHGDLYAALTASGRLDELLAEGIKYMFVSNSDNLGATLDLKMLSHFAGTDSPFMMECCERTENDITGKKLHPSHRFVLVQIHDEDYCSCFYVCLCVFLFVVR